MANAVLDPQFLARTFFDIERRLDGLEGSRDTADSIQGNNSAAILATQTGLIRAAIVSTTITASSGYPNLGSGSIKLLSLSDPSVQESAPRACFNFKTGSYAVNAIVIVVMLGTSYFVIPT